MTSEKIHKLVSVTCVYLPSPIQEDGTVAVSSNVYFPHTLNAIPMSPVSSTVHLADRPTTDPELTYLNSGLTSALRRCEHVIRKAGARGDPAFEPLIGRY